MESETVEVIKEYIKEKRAEERIVNEVVRDDVFSVLQKECTVLYYALDEFTVDRITSTRGCSFMQV